jgi:hypothetical protein
MSIRRRAATSGSRRPSNAQTRLPILDGGFDQHQIILGVTRHLETPAKRPNSDDYAVARVGPDPGE